MTSQLRRGNVVNYDNINKSFLKAAQFTVNSDESYDLQRLIAEDVNYISQSIRAKLSILAESPDVLFSLDDNSDIDLSEMFREIEPLIDKALKGEKELYRRIYQEKEKNKFRKISAPCYKVLDRIEWRKLASFFMTYYENLIHLDNLGVRSKVFLIMDDNEFPNLFKGIRSLVKFALKTDIASYSESIPHNTLIGIIDKLKIQDKAKMFLKWYVKNQYICFGDKLVKMERGIVQGGHVTDPLLLLVTRTISYHLAKRVEGLYIFVKKDDFLILGNDRALLNKTRELLEDILKDFGFEISKEKTELVEFGKNEKRLEFLSYSIDEFKEITVRASSWEKLKLEIKKKLKKIHIPCAYACLNGKDKDAVAIMSWTERILKKIIGRLASYPGLVDYYDRDVLDAFQEFLSRKVLRGPSINELARFG